MQSFQVFHIQHQPHAELEHHILLFFFIALAHKVANYIKYVVFTVQQNLVWGL